MRKKEKNVCCIMIGGLYQLEKYLFLHFLFQNQPVSLIGVFAWHILLYIDHPCVGITVNVK